MIRQLGSKAPRDEKKPRRWDLSSLERIDDHFLVAVVSLFKFPSYLVVGACCRYTKRISRKEETEQGWSGQDRKGGMSV